LHEGGQDGRGGCGRDGAALESETTALADVTYSDRGRTTLLHRR
jgi:hypothetical protein